MRSASKRTRRRKIVRFQPRSIRAIELLEARNLLTSTALALDGAGSFFEVPHAPSLTFTSGLTIEAWVMSNENRCETILSKFQDTSGFGDFEGFSLGFCTNQAVADGKIRVSFGSEPALVSAHRVKHGSWTHTAATWDPVSHEAKLYVNGELEGSGILTAPEVNSTSPIYVGALNSSGGQSFKGAVSEVRIWNVERSQDAIRQSMHTYLNERLPGLISMWHFSDEHSTADMAGGLVGVLRGGAQVPSTASPSWSKALQSPPKVNQVPMDTAHPSLPQRVTRASVAGPDGIGDMWLIGGQSETGAISSSILRFTPSSAETRVIGGLPEARVGAAAAFDPGSGSVFLFGGLTTGGYESSILAIDPSGSTRELSVSLPAMTMGMRAVYIPHLQQILLIGGEYSSDGDIFLGQADAFLFDPASETLNVVAGLLERPRMGFGLVYSELTKTVFLFGGQQNGALVSSISAIKITADGNHLVERVLPTPLPAAVMEVATTLDVKTGLIYLVGGRGTNSPLSSVWSFDPLSEQTFVLPTSLSTPRSAVAAAYDPINRRLYSLGGVDAAFKVSDQVASLDIGEGPLVPVSQWDFPSGPAGGFTATVNGIVTAMDASDRLTVIGTDRGFWVKNSSGQIRGPFLQGQAVRDVAVFPGGLLYYVVTDNGAHSFVTENASSTNVLTLLDLQATKITSVDVSASGQFVFGTDKGLRYFALDGQGQLKLYAVPGASIKDLRHARDGELYYIDELGDLFRFQYVGLSGTTTKYSRLCGLMGRLAPNSIAFTPSGELHFSAGELVPFGEFKVAYRNRGVCRVPMSPNATPDTGRANLLVPPIGENVSTLDSDGDGRVWAAFATDAFQLIGPDNSTTGGLVAYETSATGVRTQDWWSANAPVGWDIESSGLEHSSVAVLSASREEIWFVNVRGELTTFSQRWRQLEESNRLGDSAIEHVWLSRGRAFLAAANQLSVLSPDGVTWTNHPGIHTRSLMTDRSGRVWVGSDDGVRWWNPSGLKVVDSRQGTAPQGVVHAIAEDAKGRIWVGGDQGLSMYDRGRWVLTFNSTNSALPASPIRSLLVDGLNRLWVGTDEGLVEYSDNAFKPLLTKADGLPENGVTDLALMKSGEIAISTGSFVAIMEVTPGLAPKFREQVLPTGRVAEDSVSLDIDEQGRLWAGNSVLKGEQWQRYDEVNSGLLSDTISGVASDGAGRIWFGHAPEGGVSIRSSYLAPLEFEQPIIDQVEPRYANVGSGPITITGSGFGNQMDSVRVWIGKAEAKVVSVTPFAIRAEVSPDAVSGEVTVRVNQRSATRSQVTGGGPAFCAVPLIRNFTPTGGNTGVEIKIEGANFDPFSRVRLRGVDHRSIVTDTQSIRFVVQPEDVSGGLQVANSCPGAEMVAATEFRKINVKIDHVALNQGLQAYGLVANKPTLVQAFASIDQVPRDTDSLQLSNVSVEVRDPATGNVSRMSGPVFLLDPFTGKPVAEKPFPYSVGNTPASAYNDLARSLNLTVWPGPLGDKGGNWTVTTSLEQHVDGRGNVDVARDVRLFQFKDNRPLKVLLAPMVRSRDQGDVSQMIIDMESRLQEARNRIYPFGRLDFDWSYPIVLPDDEDPIQIGNFLEMYDRAHALSDARDSYNRIHGASPALVSLGVVHSSLAAGDPGFGFGADVSDLINKLALNVLDTLCDAALGVAEVLSFGLFENDGCSLDIPLYVGLVKASVGSDVIVHEVGHVAGLVKPYAGNGSFFDNVSHSTNDEFDDGSCNSAGKKFNRYKTLHMQPGVRNSGPVINPLTMKQFVQYSDGDNRGKAIMSYACSKSSENVFFEPVDLDYLWGSDLVVATGIAAVALRVVLPGLALTEAGVEKDIQAARQEELVHAAAASGEVPLLHVSGMIDPQEKSGEIRNLSADFSSAVSVSPLETGYSLVQLDDQGQVLSSAGIYPIFSRDQHTDHEHEQHDADIGVFSANLVRQPRAVRIELRHDGVVLDSRSAGAQPPIVENVRTTLPNSGTILPTDRLEIQWTENDADGDSLTSSVYFSRDRGANWTSLGPGKNGSLLVPLERVGGGSEVFFRVTVSDGLQAASADSAAISLPFQPPLPAISIPAPDRLLEGRTIILQGSAFDVQDGYVNPANLSWSSSLDGPLGTGAFVLASLSAGRHEIELRAMNQAGLFRTTSITLDVLGDYDLDGVADLDESSRGVQILSDRVEMVDQDGDGLSAHLERLLGTQGDLADSDGDGRTDGEEFADGSDPATSDALPDPLTVAAFPSRIDWVADFSKEQVFPQQIVQVTSARMASWQLSANVDWLRAVDREGITPGGTTVVAAPYLLEDGVHEGELTFTVKDQGTVTVPVSITVSHREEYFDCDGNGILDIGDHERMLAMAQGSTPAELRCDLNRDGSIDAVDQQLSDDFIEQHNERPRDITLSSTSVAELVAGSVVGQVSVTDPDPSDTHLYSTSDTRFVIVDGQLKLAAGQQIDYGSETKVSLEITASDPGGLSLSKTFQILVTPKDGDSDSVRDSVETSAPNQGDGNKDGKQDWQQANVASLPAGKSGFNMTIVVDPASALSQVVTLTEPPQALPPGFEVDQGYFEWIVKLPSTGGVVDVAMYHDARALGTAVFYYGNVPGEPAASWHRMSAKGRTGVGATSLIDRTVLSFVDGGAGDSDLAADGFVRFHGTVARDARLFPWTNPDNRYDVDDDGKVQPFDALLIINSLNVSGGRQLQAPRPGNAPPNYIDVSSNQFLEPLDALLIINELNRGSSEPFLGEANKLFRSQESSDNLAAFDEFYSNLFDRTSLDADRHFRRHRLSKVAPASTIRSG